MYPYQVKNKKNLGKKKRKNAIIDKENSEEEITNDILNRIGININENNKPPNLNN
jgi:hypothetical protein